MKILQINTTVNTGSTGRIVEAIGNRLQQAGHESYIAFGRNERPSKNNLIRIGTQKDVYLHVLRTLLTDRHGFGSGKATLNLIEKIKVIKPDIIGLHNLHGYYLNIELLFNFLKNADIPILWTLFDCWAFTGHCTYYDSVGCEKWKSECFSCPKKKAYPSSYLLDNSRLNFNDKKRLFKLPKKMHLIVHSKWLKKQVKESFLKDLPLHHIYNGTDLNVFRPKIKNDNGEVLILGVANIWSERKGLTDFKELRKLLSIEKKIVLIGLSNEQIKHLPEGITGIQRTDNIEELVDWYNRADVFINPTYQDNFPTTNIEAMACGTPVITYDTGGSIEAIDENTGLVVKKGDIKGLTNAVLSLLSRDKRTLIYYCRQRAESIFNQDKQYDDYIELYKAILSRSISK